MFVRFDAFVVAAFSIATAVSATAQSRSTSADLTAIVLDRSGAAIAGADVLVVNVETNLERRSVSRADGRVDVQAIAPGTYRVRTEASGFSPHVIEDLQVRLGDVTALEIVMEVAGVQEQVTVASDAALLNLSQTVVASVVSTQHIERLPINGRNFISFALITPGVVADRMPMQGASATSGLAFGGQRARSNNVTVDGLDNNDDVLGSVRATFSQEAVREFQVMAQSYSAEFGKASSGVVNIVTQSGTNERRGTAFAYLRDDALNAKEHFEKFDPSGAPANRAKAPYRQLQYGAVTGGPLRRNRTFYFASFERLDVAANNFVNIDDTTPVVVPGQTPGTAAGLLRAAGFLVDTGYVPYDVTANQLLVKVDHNVTPTQNLTFRYTYGDGYNENLEAWGGLVARSRGALLDNRDNMFATSHQSVLSARVVNELRFQVAGRDQHVLSLDPTCSGICDLPDEGGPTVEIAGVASVGRHRVTPQVRANTRYQVLDTLSYQRGEHLWKAGIDVNAIRHPESTLPLQFGGRYIFTPLPAIPGVVSTPLSAIQAFALGLPAAYAQGYGIGGQQYNTSDLSVFVQDTWRLDQRMTLQVGLRYQTQFWPDRSYTVRGRGAYTLPADRNNIAPRLGFNWIPPGRADMSFRASYGIYYDNIPTFGFVADIVNGQPNGVRTLVARIPQSLPAWSAPGRRLPESAFGPFPSLVIALDPGLEASYAHHVSTGVDRAVGTMTLSATVAYIRGFNQIGTIDYNPLVATLGNGRRPEDVDGVPGTSASVLQYTAYGDTWYRALSVAVRKRVSDRTHVQGSYVLSKAEDVSSDFQSAFIPEDNGRGRDPGNPNELPLAFDPNRERGASQQDQRHRIVFSGWHQAPGAIQISGIVTFASGAPFNILAGSDLNGDGDGGNFPADRARRTPGDPASALPRNFGRLPSDANVDIRISRRFTKSTVTLEPMLEIFNLFNRTNVTDINNVFGLGAFPTAPLPTYGQFVRAAAPRQAQVAARLTF